MQYRLSDFQKTRFPPIDTPCLLKFERGCTRHDSPVDYRELTKLKEHRRGEHCEPEGRRMLNYEKKHKIY